MKYPGSKRRIAKYIIPIMEKERKPGQWWVEPFVGGGNSIDKVSNPRLGADSNQWTIDALISIRDHLNDLPKNNLEFTKEDYMRIKEGGEHPYKGYISFVCSFMGIFFKGWARNGKGGDYVREAYSSATKQSPKLQGLILECADYRDLSIPPRSIIYCDPPYKRTNASIYKGLGKTSRNFDYELFWKWCEGKTKEGHIVFVSEFVAPKNWTCVFEKVVMNNFKTSRDLMTEKLFRLL